jgi:hypothetical protein
MTLSEIYNQNPTLFGSPKMVAFYEALANIPCEDRVISPVISPISVTSDGHMISGGNYLGTFQELEQNMYALCEHFEADAQEAENLLKNITDWRIGGNAYGNYSE